MRINSSAFDDEGLAPDGGEAFPVVDPDGLPVPAIWHFAVERWMQLPRRTREMMSGHYVREIIKARAAKPKPSRAPVVRYTTDYCIKWGKRQGWTLLARERYDHRTKRHHDLTLGADALFSDGTTSQILVQGAGKSERKAHRDRYLARGGDEKLLSLGWRFVYVEFDRHRGASDPILIEWWGSPPG